jgi:hypothetical protein
MNAPSGQTEATPEADFTKTWRYKLGLAMIVGGNLGIVGAVLMGFMGLSSAAVGAIVVGGEVISLASIVFLGKEGFKAIKAKFLGFLKSSYTAPVSQTRHRIGILLLLTHVATGYLIILYAWEAFGVAAAKGADAAVWGLNLSGQSELVFTLFLIGEISFLVSIYVLGADWWGKFRRIFVWEAAER